MHTRLLSGGALVAVTAIVAAGCGGGSSKNDAYANSKTDYAAALSSICQGFEAKTANLQSLQDIAEQGDDLLSTFKAAIKQVASLKAPAEIQDAVDSFLENSDKQVVALAAVVKAAKAGDEAAAQKAQEEGSALNKEGDTAVNEIGATGCLSTS